PPRRSARVSRGLALVMVLGAMVLSAPPAVRAQGPGKGLEQRVSALEAQVTALSSQIAALKTQLGGQAGVVAAQGDLLAHFSRQGNDLFITGANLHILSGLGATNGNPAFPDSVDPSSIVTNGLGNLIVGYNEDFQPPAARNGSHN